MHSIRCGLTRPRHAVLCDAPALESAWHCMALVVPRYSVWRWRCYWCPEKAIGAPGSMLIGNCGLGGKLGSVTSKGAAALVLVRSRLDVEARGSACAHVTYVAHSRAGITLSMFRIMTQLAPGDSRPALTDRSGLVNILCRNPCCYR